MKDLLKILRNQGQVQDFDAIRIGLASPHQQKFVPGLTVK